MISLVGGPLDGVDVDVSARRPVLVRAHAVRDPLTELLWVPGQKTQVLPVHGTSEARYAPSGAVFADGMLEYRVSDPSWP